MGWIQLIWAVYFYSQWWFWQEHEKTIEGNLFYVIFILMARVGKDEANLHLVGLLDTLDPKKFYNRVLFEENKGFNYIWV